MNKTSLFVIILFYSTWLNGQPGGVEKILVELNEDQKDYSFIDTLLQDKKLVLLGEMDHGDGSSFKIKTDLIKYLHEELGYNTLLFESSFINCNLLWSTIGDSTIFKDRIKNNIYFIWSEVEETKALFQYIEEQHRKGTPLRILGIDPQFSGEENTEEFVALLNNALPPTITTSKMFSDFIHELKIMSIWMKFPKKTDHRLTEKKFLSYCDTLLESIRNNEELSTDLPLWEMYIDNLKVLGIIKRKRDRASFESRDKQMYANTTYWLNQYPQQKFIVWAANAHIIRNDVILKEQGNKHYLFGINKLGDYLHEDYSNDMYSISFTSGKGATLDFLNPPNVNLIRNPPDNSLEGLMSGRKACFVDLKLFEDSMSSDRYDAQLFYTNVRCTAKWSRHFDGFIYIPEMFPSTPLWIK